MSYNLLLDTNFTKIGKHWKLNNCEYKDGYLIGKGKLFSIEQKIILPDPTRLYFSMEYLCFDSNIKSIYCGIFCEHGVLEATKKKPCLRKRKRISVVNKESTTEKIKVMLIVESKTLDSKIYIDSPLLIDLNENCKPWWPVNVLNSLLDYRYGYDYANQYKESEITYTNSDFQSPYSKTEKAKCGVIITSTEDDWFELDVKLDVDKKYLVKLDFEEINNFGNLFLQYGEYISSNVTNEQLYMIFKANNQDKLKLKITCKELLPYMFNLKHLLIIDLTNQKIEEGDLKHLPFI